MDQQSFRSQLVEWLKEITPFSHIDKYSRKTREAFNASPTAKRDENGVTYIVCTATHTYSISAHHDYLGCIAWSRIQRPGETWTRGNDLPDGKFCRETWDAIKEAIVRYELVKLVEEPKSKRHGADNAVIFPVAIPPNPEEAELNRAWNAFFEAREKYERLERVYLKEHANREDMPADRAKDEPTIA
jgi:hypothetical protein